MWLFSIAGNGSGDVFGAVVLVGDGRFDGGGDFEVKWERHGADAEIDLAGMRVVGHPAVELVAVGVEDRGAASREREMVPGHALVAEGEVDGNG